MVNRMTHYERLKPYEQDIIAKYVSGKTSTELGKEYGVNGYYIWHILKNNNIKTRNNHKHKDGEIELLYKEMALELYDQGMPMYQISQKLDICNVSLNRLIKKYRFDTNKYSTQREDKLKNHTENIIKLYISGNSIVKISKIYKCSDVSVLRLLNDNGVDTTRVRKHNFNKRYLDAIDTPGKAWVWGLMLTDGNNNRDGLRLEMTDLDIIEKFKKEFEFTGQIYIKKPKIEHYKTQYCCCIGSMELSRRATELGCPPAKTFSLEYPDEKIIPKHLIRYFILGLLDGDGSVSVNSVNWTGTTNLLLGIEKVLLEIGVDKDKIYWYNRYPEKGEKYNIRSLSVSTIENTRKILSWLYDSPVICGDRKRAIVEEWLKNHPVV